MYSMKYEKKENINVTQLCSALLLKFQLFSEHPQSKVFFGVSQRVKAACLALDICVMSFY